MDWKTLLFSPSGRVNRARYWLTLIAIDVVFSIFYVPFAVTLKPDQQSITGTQAALLVVIGVLGLVASYSGIILGIKRFHDRDKSGWWLLLYLVPIIGPLWLLVELGFLRGTIGRNRFGPDPLAPNDDIVQVFGGAERQSIR